MKLLSLSNSGDLAMVDDDIYEYLSQYCWRLVSRKNAIIGRRTTLGRVIWKLKYGPIPRDIDVGFINKDFLDCRIENLRLMTQSQRSATKVTQSTKIRTKYKGVYWDKARSKWLVQIKKNGAFYHLGRYEDEIEAARAYNAKAVELFGEYAHLNQVDKK